MDDLYELLRAGQLVVYGALGVIAVLQWRSRRTPATAWLAATFGTLGLVIVGARLLPADAESANSVARKALVAGLLLFPYFLYQFTRTFVVRARWIYAFATGVTAGLVVATFLLELPATGEARSPAFTAFVYLIVVQWVGLTGLVTFRLWRDGRGQPPVARVRMRLLGAGAFGITAALVIAAFAPQGSDVRPENIAGQLIALVSGPLFLLGFSPPAIVRTWWRQRTVPLLPTELALMGATTPGEVGAILLPEASELMGGRGAVLATTDREVLGRFALREEEADALVTRALDTDGHADVIAVSLENSILAVEASPFTPFFGREETALLSHIAVLADLAMARTVLDERERRATEQLSEAQALAHVGSWQWDVVADEITWSDELYRIYGFAPGEIIPTREIAVDRVHPDDRERVAAEIQVALDDHESTSMSEYRIVLSDGSQKVVQARGRAERDGDGTLVRMVGTAQDITARKREEEIRDQFIANAAHELRTPLTALLGFLQLLTEREGLSPDQVAVANAAVTRAGERMGTLVNNLLDLTKLRQGALNVAMERVDVTALLDELLTLVPPPAGRHVAITSNAVGIARADGDAGAVAALTNRHRLEQILVNLLTNAYRYGGTRIEVEATAIGGAVGITVVDDGPGVEPDLVPHLFEPFTRGQTSAQVGGSGLGLAIAAAVAEAIGGRLSYEPGDGAGSRFILELKAAT